MLTQVLALLETCLVRSREARDTEALLEFEQFVRAHPDCLLRSCLTGHLTGSAWITDAARKQVLLTHHRKLGKWLQLGGHADGEPNLLQVALKEAREESGLHDFKPLSELPFDVDKHWIPERRGVPGHWHFDLRFHLIADPATPLVVSEESKELAWVELARLEELSTEESMFRMRRKTLKS